jgi:hypothetical protein
MAKKKVSAQCDEDGNMTEKKPTRKKARRRKATARK